MEILLNAIFGEKCYFCGRAGKIICYKCELKAKVCKYGVCIKCQEPSILGTTHFLCKKKDPFLPSQLCAVYEYEGLVSQVIKKSKYQPKAFALLKALSFSGAMLASKFGFDFGGYVVVPIPISKSREKDRGFNQAELIAKAVSKEFGLTMENSILIRTRDTSKQFGLHKDERGQNIMGAFDINQKYNQTTRYRVNQYNAILGDIQDIKKDRTRYEFCGSASQNGGFDRFLSKNENACYSGQIAQCRTTQNSVISGGRFLLVDDICTTGSTLIEASKVLYSYGAKDVKCFTLSRKV